MDLKGYFFYNACWVVGDRLKVHLWKDRWLDMPLVNLMHLNLDVVLNAKVSDILIDVGWNHPNQVFLLLMMHTIGLLNKFLICLFLL